MHTSLAHILQQTSCITNMLSEIRDQTLTSIELPHHQIINDTICSTDVRHGMPLVNPVLFAGRYLLRLKEVKDSHYVVPH